MNDSGQLQQLLGGEPRRRPELRPPARGAEKTRQQLAAMQEALTAVTLSRNRYADFYEFAPSAYMVLDAGGAIAEVNRAGADLLGLGREELLKEADLAIYQAKAGGRNTMHFFDPAAGP
jgi:PAS domain-containing protein